MKTRRKSLCLLLAACLAVSLFSVSAVAASTSCHIKGEEWVYMGQCGDGVYYAMNACSGTLRIWGSGAIDDYAFGEASLFFPLRLKVAHIVIEDGVTAIGDYAFYRYLRLQDVTLPTSGLVEIGKSAFYTCPYLEQVNLPYGLREIGELAFSECRSLTAIAFPGTLEKIGEGAFAFDYSLTEVSMPDGLTTIGASAFDSCINLTRVVVPDTVTAIGDYAFSHCGALACAVLPEHLETIAYGLFAEDTSLATVYIPRSVKTIEEEAFFSCCKLHVLYGGSSAQCGLIQIGQFHNEELVNAQWTYNVGFTYGDER